MKNILVIHTGGTISMEEDKQTGEVKPGLQNPLLSKYYDFKDITIYTNGLFYLPSPHITTKEMLILKQTIETEIIQKKLDGVVVTHGTDTLEETAYFLDLLCNATIPIVLTGAMRSNNELGSDGLYNLITSIRVAASDKSKDLGVLVVMNDEIHSAVNVTKTHTSNIATFQSPQYGPIGIVTKKAIVFHQKLLSRRKINVTELNKNVLLLKAFAGMDHLLFEAIEQIHVDGLVIEALGQGNLPPQTISGVKKILKKSIPIVIVSRSFNGIVQDIYSYEGGGKQLRDLGVILSHSGLNGPKARIKLMAALQHTNDFQQLKEIFEQ